MMKSLSLVVVIAALAVAYDAKYDNFDAESIVKDPAMLEWLMKCLANMGPCNEVAAAYKELMSEVVLTTCGKCSPRQKEILTVVMGTAKNQMPDLYTAFKQEYDPNNKNGGEFDAFVSGR